MAGFHGLLAVLLLLPLFAAEASARENASPRPVERAQTLLGSGDVSGAIKLLVASLKVSPGDAVAHNLLGSIFNREGRYREALHHASEAARLQPNHARYRYNKGIVLAEHGRFREALAEFDFAIAKTPAEAAMYLERGAALLSLDEGERARADWAFARKLDPKLVWIDWYEGLHDLLDGRHNDAIAALKRVATAEPQFAASQGWLVVAHILAGRKHEPRQVQDRWVQALLDFHAGRMTGDRLLQIAGTDTTTGDRRRMGEAWLHRGLGVRAQEPAAAREAFHRAAETEAPRHVWKLLAERLRDGSGTK